MIFCWGKKNTNMFFDGLWAQWGPWYQVHAAKAEGLRGQHDRYDPAALA